jgi:hypothetical protein
MLFMVIETFERDDMVPVYRHIREHGRQLPEGLTVEGSWTEPAMGRVFQLMACDDARLLQEWVLRFRGLGVRFEIVPVISSMEAREVAAPYLDGEG